MFVYFVVFMEGGRSSSMKLPRTTIGKYSVEAVAKALDILEVFDGSEALTLNEVSRRVNLNKSRAFRLLHTLAERGYVDRGPDASRYQLGVKLFERAANVRRDVKQLARPFMESLHNKFNETVNLGVLNQGSVLYVDILESSRPFRMAATVGCRMPVHLTSMGKAMLANLAAESRAQPENRRPAGPRRKQVQIPQRELDRVRDQGYAIDNEENEPGVACIGAAILDEAGRPVAALSVSGPARRILGVKNIIAQAVVASCSNISKSLGFNGPLEK
jgi:DNA-binding IclR family transcriptional regulator